MASKFKIYMVVNDISYKDMMAKTGMSRSAIYVMRNNGIKYYKVAKRWAHKIGCNINEIF